MAIRIRIILLTFRMLVVAVKNLQSSIFIEFSAFLIQVDKKSINQAVNWSRFIIYEIFLSYCKNCTVQDLIMKFNIMQYL